VDLSRPFLILPFFFFFYVCFLSRRPNLFRRFFFTSSPLSSPFLPSFRQTLQPFLLVNSISSPTLLALELFAMFLFFHLGRQLSSPSFPFRLSYSDPPSPFFLRVMFFPDDSMSPRRFLPFLSVSKSFANMACPIFPPECAKFFFLDWLVCQISPSSFCRTV